MFAYKPHARAQGAPCLPPTGSASAGGQPSGPKISIAEVTFLGALQMPLSDQNQIADLLKKQDYGASANGRIDGAIERVRAGWQDRGYFKVKVSGREKMLRSSPDSQRVALRFHVEEGLQYTLAEIAFRNNKAINDVSTLRGLFPISDGDIFSREKIAKGLENLSKTYGDRGYINFTAVPDTSFEDQKKLITLDIDMDEGRQFYVGTISVLGLDEPTRQELLKSVPTTTGQVYTSELWESFLRKYGSMLPQCGCLKSARPR
jgi:outer membrane protein assembly factor BamA